MRTWVLVGVIVAASTGTALAQDAAAGEQSFNKCRPCHDIGPDAKIKLGPPLNGIDGRKAASFPGFNYSDGLKASGITWNKDKFLQWITAPQAMVAGTRMAFAGDQDATDRENLWAYVSQFKADGSK
ncbi:MAG TPA: c-type cytochrome [Xanthobacteraceae bacterium]|jgi:cytochrome c|nr:c-type cytochrome [Xanthobacteraceae bacterium]